MTSIRFTPSMRAGFVLSAAAGLVIAIWLTFRLAGWSEDGVVGWIPESTLLAALVIIGLLAADTFMPIPATIVMLASGALFGPVAGSVLNAVGLGAAALTGYTVGAALSRGDRSVGTAMQHRMWMIAATRGLPVLSESFAIGAGALGYPITKFAKASAIGAMAAGSVFAVAGWQATNHWSLIIVAAMLAAGGYLAMTRQIRRTMPGDRVSVDHA